VSHQLARTVLPLQTPSYSILATLMVWGLVGCPLKARSRLPRVVEDKDKWRAPSLMGNFFSGASGCSEALRVFPASANIVGCISESRNIHKVKECQSLGCVTKTACRAILIRISGIEPGNLAPGRWNRPTKSECVPYTTLKVLFLPKNTRK
jgi:hypothetical protein